MQDNSIMDTVAAETSFIPEPHTSRALDPAHALRTAPLFGFNSRDKRSRPFNLLRSQMLRILRDKSWRIIGITSATPKVGKTFNASNLAASLSRVPDLRVLLIDLDLRRASVAENFAFSVEQGIEEWLAGTIDTLHDIAVDVPDTNLTILPCKRVETSSAELLAGKRLGQLFAEIRKLPGNVVCLCDLPPAFANDDASIVMNDADAYLFVVEEGRTTAKQIRDSIRILQPAPLLGTVLNRYQGGLAGDDYGFGYGTSRYYNKYYE